MLSNTISTKRSASFLVSSAARATSSTSSAFVMRHLYVPTNRLTPKMIRMSARFHCEEAKTSVQYQKTFTAGKTRPQPPTRQGVTRDQQSDEPLILGQANCQNLRSLIC